MQYLVHIRTNQFCDNKFVSKFTLHDHVHGSEPWGGEQSPKIRSQEAKKKLY